MILVPLQLFVANPYQTRHGVDPEHVKELAADIASRAEGRPETCGLLQVPAGRLVKAEDGLTRDYLWSREQNALEMLLDGSDEWRVQLAYGHSRLEAFRLLVQSRPDDFELFPVELVRFTDEEMATAAWAENAARKDLSPIEEADAIARMIEVFGWTHEQAGKRLGLSRSAVSNKLRLRGLPEEFKAQVQAGVMSERQAMAILPALDLPEAGRQRAKYYWNQLEAAVKNPGNQTADTLRKKVQEVVAAATIPLDENTPPPDLEIAVDGTRAARCQGCEMMVTSNGVHRCKDAGCFNRRLLTWQRAELAAAAEAVGIPTIDPEEQRELDWNTYTEFREWGYGKKYLDHARAHSCPHLRLTWREYRQYDGVLRPDGFRRIAYLCVNPQSVKRCGCEEAVRAAENAEKQAQMAAAKEQRDALRGQVDAAVGRALAGLDDAARRVLLFVLHDYQSDRQKLASLKGKRLDHMLVERVVGKSLNFDAFGIQENVEAWAQVTGLKLAEEQKDPVADIRRRWERLKGWMDKAEQYAPTTAQAEGNWDNLNRIADEVAALNPHDPEVMKLQNEVATGLLQMSQISLKAAAEG